MSEVHGLTSEDVERFERNDRLIREGMCPNGCGLLTEMGTAEILQSCGTCGFITNAGPRRGPKQ